MHIQVEVVLAIGGKQQHNRHTARLVAIARCDGSSDRWSGEAQLHSDTQTGRIRLGQLVAPGDTPADVLRALGGAIEHAWHHSGDVLVCGADGQALNEAQTLAELKRWAGAPKLRQIG